MTKPRIDRVMIALDSTKQSQSALKAAVELAARLNVELIGLFVEDIKLLQLASLPFAREIVYGSETKRNFSCDDMERSLRNQAERLRQGLEKTALHAQVHCSFQVTRGMVAAELLSVANEGDLLVLGKAIKKTGLERRLGSTLQAIITQACCSVALLERGKTLARPVMILYEGSETSQRALTLAIQLALSDSSQLNVVLPAVDPNQRDRLGNEVEQMAGTQKIRTQTSELCGNTVENILNIIAQDEGQVFIIDATSEILDDEKRQQLLTESTCPIVFFR